MLNVDESIVIAQPRQQVWEFLSDPESVPLYSSNIVEYELVSGEKYGVGRMCEGVAKVAGRRLDIKDEAVEVEHGRRLKLESRDTAVPYTIVIECADEGEGTKVSWHQEAESFKGFFRFADPLVIKLYSRDVRSNLENAKTILEG